LTGELAVRVRDLNRDICTQHEIQITKGHVAKDHVCWIDSHAGKNQPFIAVAKREDGAPFVGKFPHLKKQFLGRHLWSRGYFCCSSGNVTDEVIAKYIAEQNIDQGEDFRVDG
jgi:putative transposase